MSERDVPAGLAPGSSLLVGTVGADGAPRAGRAWVVLPADDGRIRVLVTADDPVLVANLTPGAWVAVNGADVPTLRSAQVKGVVELVEEPSDGDLTAAWLASEQFFEVVHRVDGTELDLLHRLLPHAMLAVVLRVCDRFDQTPGPNAGDALADPAPGGDA